MSRKEQGRLDYSGIFAVAGAGGFRLGRRSILTSRGFSPPTRPCTHTGSLGTIGDGHARRKWSMEGSFILATQWCLLGKWNVLRWWGGGRPTTRPLSAPNSL
jgi:hypothetical protein